jgi:hypothetical protein
MKLKKVLFNALKAENIDISKVKIIKESATVSGPDYSFDRSNKEKYFEHQYFSITIE